jgi:DNA-binding NtrC family response regulator
MVLLLDDDEAFRSALSDLLQDDGHTVRHYGSIAELPNLAKLPPLTALITDYQLNESENGLTVAQRIRAEQPRVPVIIVTAHASDHLEKSVAATPYVWLLRKPVRYEEVRQLLLEHA